MSDNNPKADPSDVGAPVGAPRPIPATPELIATILHTFNEAEVLDELREMHAGCGRTLDQFVEELEAIANQPSEPAAKNS